MKEDRLTKFTVLEEDDADIGGYDTPSMEFRGSLTTGIQPYKNSESGCCKIVRYIIVPLITFAVGILVGYIITHTGAPSSNVTIDLNPTGSIKNTTRAVSASSQLSSTSTVAGIINTTTAAMNVLTNITGQ